MAFSSSSTSPFAQMALTASTRALLKRRSVGSLISWQEFASTAVRKADFTHCVIGGGAVGLAIARQLAQREGTSTILIERHGAVGTETSSRNSEVIHAGLYYGADSLKTKLCLQGKEMIYSLCDRYGIPYKKCGKWIVAQTEQQMEELHKVHTFAQSINVPIRFVPLEEGKRSEPSIRAEAGILESPTTGILDSHAYMQYLLGAFLSSGGDVAYNTTVTSLSPISSPTPSSSNNGYEITTTDRETDESTTFTSSMLINSAGLAACQVSNLLLPPSHHIQPFYAKGNYFSYPASLSRRLSISHLIYPAPEPGLGGLGTHLTMDMTGQLRFGPDVEYVDNPSDLSVSTSRLSEAVREIQKYLPNVEEDRLQPDYAGIRPKLGKASAVVAGKGFLDFYVQEEKEKGFEGFVNLLGIESPGLTSSLAIADYVERLLYR